MRVEACGDVWPARKIAVQICVENEKKMSENLTRFDDKTPSTMSTLICYTPTKVTVCTASAMLYAKFGLPDFNDGR